VNISNPEVNPSTTTTYILTVTGPDFSFKRTDEVKVTVIEVKLEFAKAVVKLCDEVTFTAKITPGDIKPDKFLFEIKSTKDNRWYKMAEGPSPTHTRALKVAGYFKVRVTMKAGDRECTSEEKDIEVQFPSFSDIVADATVKTAIETAWSDTKAAATRTGRREYGFWIFYNTHTCKFVVGRIVPGPIVPHGSAAEIILGAKPGDETANPGPLESLRYTVSSFHTHSPTTYRTGLPAGSARKVGPSPEDITADSNAKVVGVVYDYIGAPGLNGFIPMGHPLNSPAKLYSTGLVRRPTP
jgi:hypothetical protein